MKRRELEQLKVKSGAELRKFVEESREKLRALKFDLAAGKVKNVTQLHLLKKDIARALTLIRIQEDNSKT
jgi:ribosomal protein L29